MAVTYKKLWKLLIDKDMKKKELAALAGINPTTISKMSRGDNVRIHSQRRKLYGFVPRKTKKALDFCGNVW